MPITLTREQLHERVWETPIDTLRKEFGISNVGLGKICRHRQIPVPPRGYWAKKYAGHKLKPPPPLPKPTKPEYAALIYFHKEPAVQSEAVAEPVALRPEIAFERDPANAITVPEDLRVTHPVLRQQREYWQAVARKEVTWNDQPPHLNIHISKDSERRAMRLLQALFVALAKRGHSIAATKDGKTQITVMGETLNVSLREPSKQVLHQPTPKEKADAAKHSWMKPRPYDIVPTGELELSIEGVYGSRHRWKDGKRQRLEERLNAVIEGVVAAALLEKEREAERERERQRWEEAERRRKDRQKRRLEEEARIERFNGLVAYWRKTRERRAFLKQLRQAVGAVEAESPLGKWLGWAEAYVEGCDPLERFRTRNQTMKLYFSAYKYQIERIKEQGFEDPEPSDYQRDKYIPGIVLRDRRPAGDSLEELLEFELPEDLVLPYEVTEPGYEPRTFHLPARVLNKCMGTQRA